MESKLHSSITRWLHWTSLPIIRILKTIVCGWETNTIIKIKIAACRRSKKVVGTGKQGNPYHTHSANDPKHFWIHPQTKKKNNQHSNFKIISYTYWKKKPLNVKLYFLNSTKQWNHTPCGRPQIIEHFCTDPQFLDVSCYQ